MLSSGEMKFYPLMYLYASTSAMPSILGEWEQPHWLWMMDHILCIHRTCTTWHVHSQFSAMTVMTSIATAVVLPAALTIANSSGYCTKKCVVVNVWVSQWQPTLLGDVLSLKDGLPHITTLGSTSINILEMWHLTSSCCQFQKSWCRHEILNSGEKEHGMWPRERGKCICYVQSTDWIIRELLCKPWNQALCKQSVDFIVQTADSYI